MSFTLKKSGINLLTSSDVTGKSSYKPEDFERICHEFVRHHLEEIYFSTSETFTKISGELRNSQKIVVTQDEIMDPMLESISYVGYTEGNFKYINYLLIAEGEIEVSSISTKGRLYFKIDKSIPEIGRIFSAVSNLSVKIGEKTEVENNILKMMKRNKYQLKKRIQKKFLFGKGHLQAGELKSIIKNDLNIIFEFMKTSKEKAKNQDFTPSEFKISGLQYFEFERS